ncbi:MAG: formate dehydrogenase accessory sulfurtransferase FdhD [Xanthomonadales bacterium]|nr:formate dehydrogenase accessory sulfurtransferase FdhD [Xanthomonadales bacterium]
MKVWRLQGRQGQPREEMVAEEVPVGLIFNGQPQVVLMATPRDLDDLAVGHALSEGLIDDPEQLQSIETLQRPEGLLHHCAVRGLNAVEGARSEALAGSGCGLCGVQALQAIRRPPPLPQPFYWTARRIRAGMRALAAAQPLNQASGGLHAAAALLPGEPLRLLVREDVGRHNAVDKVIGALARAQWRAEAMLVTSRASFELVQKTAAAHIPLLAAVSAPTSAAVALAQDCQLSLLAFVRGQRMTRYAGPPADDELASAAATHDRCDSTEPS